MEEIKESKIEYTEKNEIAPSIIVRSDINDQDSMQSRDSIEREINEQDQIKNSEESNYEDIEESNSPFLLKQIQESKKYQEKNDNLSENDEEDYEDEDEFLDDDDCDEVEKTQINEKNIEELDVKNAASSNENVISLKVNEVDESLKEINETTPQKLELSRQTSQNSNNSITTPVNPALTPSKKGGFYEHDNRDEEEKKNYSDQSKELSRKSSFEIKQTGFPIIKPHKIEKSTSESNEDTNNERWRHDLYENHEKNEKKPNQFNRNRRPKNFTDKTKKENISSDKSNNDKISTKTKPKLFSQNSENKNQLNINPLPDKAVESTTDETNQSNKKEFIKQDQEISNKSKGLSLSEYLEQKGEVSEEKLELKPKRRPNIQPYQPHQRFSNNDDSSKENQNYKDKKKPINEKGDTNINSDLKKRLDFSTRKPINKSNFDENLEVDEDFDKNPNRKYNLKITASMDSSKRTVQEEPLQNQNEINAASYNQNRFNSTNYSSKKYHIKNNDQQNFNNKNRNTYDEYYVPAEDTSGKDSVDKIGYFKPKRYYDRNKQEKKLEYDGNQNNQNEFNNRYFKNDQQYDRNKSKIVQNELPAAASNYNDYSEYATYNNNDFNQQYNSNNNNFHVKSQSYSNSNNRNRNQQTNNDFNERTFKSQQEFQRNQSNQMQQPYFQNNFRQNNLNSQQFTNQQNYQNNDSNFSFSNDHNFNPRTNQF